LTKQPCPAWQAFTIYFDGRIPTPMKTATVTYTDGRTLPPGWMKRFAAGEPRVFERESGNDLLSQPGTTVPHFEGEPDASVSRLNLVG